MKQEHKNAQHLRALADAVKDWSNGDQAWVHPDPDYSDVALFGHINEDGEQYPVAEVNADTYGHEGVSLGLAQFYAAANPAAVLALLDRVAELEAEAALHLQELRAYRLTVDNLEAVNKAPWISVSDALPPPYEEVIIYPRPTDYCCEGSVNTQGQWSYGEYETGFGHHSNKCNVTHWMAMPASPAAIARSEGDA